MNSSSSLPDYSATDTTGGRPPHQRFAPTKAGGQQRRLERGRAAAALAAGAARERDRAAARAAEAVHARGSATRAVLAEVRAALAEARAGPGAAPELLDLLLAEGLRPRPRAGPPPARPPPEGGRPRAWLLPEAD